MKVLLVITKSEIGGAQTFVINLARYLRAKSIEVEVVAGEGGYLFTELQKFDIPYYYFKSLKRNFSVFSSLSFIFALKKLLKKNNYLIVHLNSSNTLVGAYASLFLKKKPKMVFTFHGLSFLDENFSVSFLIKPFAKLYFKSLLKMVDKSVFVSSINYQKARQNHIINDAAVIYNGLGENSLEYLEKEDAREYFSSRFKINIKKSFLIGSIGRLAYPKNYEFLIINFHQIKRKIPEAKAIIIGAGPYNQRLSKQITKLGLQNDFFLVGAIPDSYKFIKAFDIFSLPSRYEGLSISLIEAIWGGVPILASDVGGNSEIVNAEQLFTLNDIDEFIKKLLIIKNNPLKFSNRNYQLREQFSLDKMGIEYKMLYEELCSKD